MIYSKYKINLNKNFNHTEIKNIEKAVKKLKYFLNISPIEAGVSHPAVHDSFQNNFYTFKYITKGGSLRILYRLKNNLIEVHLVYFKKGNSSQSSYIGDFEKYIENYKE